MEVRFTLTDEDFEALHERALLRHLRLMRSVFLLALLLFLLISSALVELPEEFFYPSFVTFGATATVTLGAILRILLSPPKVDPFHDGLDQFRGKSGKLAISEGGVCIEGETFQAFYHWHHFHELLQTGNHLFLHYTPNHAVIIPRNAFTSDQAFLDFARACRDYWDQLPTEPSAHTATSITMPGPSVIPSRSEEFINEPHS